MRKVAKIIQNFRRSRPALLSVRLNVVQYLWTSNAVTILCCWGDTLFLNLGARRGWVLGSRSGRFTPDYHTPVRTEWEAGHTWEPAWTFRRRQKSLYVPQMELRFLSRQARSVVSCQSRCPGCTRRCHSLKYRTTRALFYKVLISLLHCV
jgi:hypothetical protein